MGLQLETYVLLLLLFCSCSIIFSCNNIVIEYSKVSRVVAALFALDIIMELMLWCFH